MLLPPRHVWWTILPVLMGGLADGHACSASGSFSIAVKHKCIWSFEYSIIRMRIFNIQYIWIFVFFYPNIFDIRSNWLFSMNSVGIHHIFGIYSNIRHQISILCIQLFYFIGTNIFGICIPSKSKLWIYSYLYSVQNLIFVLHWAHVLHTNYPVMFDSKNVFGLKT